MDEVVQVVVRRERRVAVAVDADHLRRDALADLRIVGRLGEDHQPRVGVEIDETRRYDFAGRVDRAGGFGGGLGGGGLAVQEHPQPIALDDDRADTPRRPGPIHDRAARDEDVDAHGPVDAPWAPACTTRRDNGRRRSPRAWQTSASDATCIGMSDNGRREPPRRPRLRLPVRSLYR